MVFFDMNSFAEKLKGKPEIIKELIKNEPQYQIARAIIAELIKRGWSQEKLAKESGLTQTQVSRLENGQVGNVATLLKALAFQASSCFRKRITFFLKGVFSTTRIISPTLLYLHESMQHTFYLPRFLTQQLILAGRRSYTLNIFRKSLSRL
ncbi:MAG: helix-turn-helix transcriptional regulator [Bacillota bacterium]